MLFKRKKILIIEDEAVLRRALARALGEKRFELITTGNGREGLSMSFSEKPNLILLDLMLPGLNGIEILKELRNDEWGAKVPVLVFTNLLAGTEVEEEVRKYDADFIEKVNSSADEIVEKVKNKI